MGCVDQRESTTAMMYGKYLAFGEMQLAPCMLCPVLLCFLTIISSCPVSKVTVLAA